MATGSRTPRARLGSILAIKPPPVWGNERTWECPVIRGWAREMGGPEFNLHYVPTMFIRLPISHTAGVRSLGSSKSPMPTAKDRSSPSPTARSVLLQGARRARSEVAACTWQSACLPPDLFADRLITNTKKSRTFGGFFRAGSAGPAGRCLLALDSRSLRKIGKLFVIRRRPIAKKLWILRPEKDDSPLVFFVRQSEPCRTRAKHTRLACSSTRSNRAAYPLPAGAEQ